MSKGLFTTMKKEEANESSVQPGNAAGNPNPQEPVPGPAEQNIEPGGPAAGSGETGDQPDGGSNAGSAGEPQPTPSPTEPTLNPADVEKLMTELAEMKKLLAASKDIEQGTSHGGPAKPFSILDAIRAL